MSCFFFQNPNDGYPMVLREIHGRSPIVECEYLGEDQDQPKDGTLKDAKDMTHAVRGLAIDDAAKLLKREFGAADILD